MLNEDGKVNKIIKIDYGSIEWLKKIALSHLGLSNMNALRDRFEGQTYLNNFLKKSYLEIAFEKYSQSKVIIKEKKESIKSYEPTFIINKKKIALLSYTNEEFPKIPSAGFDIGVFGLVNLDARSVKIVGFLEKEKIMCQLRSDNSSMISNKYI
ncbi:MAG: hypothetical protein ACQUHE_14685, partial [Bacteroidia bacterium]